MTLATKNKLSKLTTASPIVPPRDHEAHERKYRAEEALRTITRAEEHKRDRALMKDVKACAREQAKTLNCVLGKK